MTRYPNPQLENNPRPVDMLFKSIYQQTLKFIDLEQ